MTCEKYDKFSREKTINTKKFQGDLDVQIIKQSFTVATISILTEVKLNTLEMNGKLEVLGRDNFVNFSCVLRKRILHWLVIMFCTCLLGQVCQLYSLNILYSYWVVACILYQFLRFDDCRYWLYHCDSANSL